MLMDNSDLHNANSPTQPQTSAGAAPNLSATGTNPAAGAAPAGVLRPAQPMPGALNSPIPGAAGPAPTPAVPTPTGPTPSSFGARPAAATPTGIRPQPGVAPTPGAPLPGAAPHPAGPAAPHLPGAAPVPGAAPNPGAVPGAVPTPGAAPAPAPAAPNAKKPLDPAAKKKRLTYIILGSVAAAVAVICVIVAVVMMLPKSQPQTQTTPAPVVQNTESDTKTPLEDMDADELLTAFDEMQEADYALPDYLPEILQPYASGYQLSLVDSYDSLHDLEEYQLFDADYELNIETAEDETFSVLTALDENGELAADQPVYVAFSSDYLVYSSINGNAGYTAGEPIPNLAFIDTSEEFVEMALPILNITYGAVPQNLTYDFAFDADDDQITLQTYVIGLSYSLSGTASGTVSSDADDDNGAINIDANDGADVDEAETEVEASADSAYRIQGALVELTVDLTTGEVSYADYDGSREQILVDFPLSEDEFSERYDQITAATGYGSASFNY